MTSDNIDVRDGGMPARAFTKAAVGFSSREADMSTTTCARPSVSDMLTQPGDQAADSALPPPPVKSKPSTSREFERAMRELGFTKSESRQIASHGFKGLAAAAPVEDVSDELETLLMKRVLNMARKWLESQNSAEIEPLSDTES